MADHIATIQGAIDAWNRRDIAGYWELYTPDVELGLYIRWPDPVGISGPNTAMTAFESIFETFERSELTAERFIADRDSVVVPCVWRSLPNDSTAWVEQRIVIGYRFAGDRIAYQGWFETLEQALDAVGLPRSLAS